MATNGKRSSISEKAKDVIMELFTILFEVMIKQFGTMEISDKEISDWEECKELDVYDELELIAKNPIRIKLQEFLDNYGLVIDEIVKTGNVQTVSMYGIYDQNIKLEAVMICLVENGKIEVVGHRVVRMVRIRKY